MEERKLLFDFDKLSFWFVPTAMIALVVLSHFYASFIVFHLFAEIFSIFVALGIGIVAYYTYPFTHNRYVLFLGLGYIWVGLLDLIHTLTFPGMQLFISNDADTTLTIWVFTRMLEAFILLAAPLIYYRQFNSLKISAYFAVFSITATLWSLFDPMTMLVAGEGLTTTKIIFEYCIIVLLLLALLHNRYRKKEFRHSIYLAIQYSIVFTIIAEIYFTLYSDINGLLILSGHVFKFISFWLIFISLIRTSLQQPVELLAKHASSYNAIPLPAVVVSSDGAVQQANKAAVQQLGMDIDDIVEQPCHLLLHPKNLSIAECPLCQAIKQHKAYTELVLNDTSKDCITRYYLSAVDKNQKNSGMIQVSIDITDGVKAKKQLDEQNFLLTEQKKQLDYKANYDSLTGLANRNLFLDRLSQAINSAQRNDELVAVIFIDLDRFKEINDSFGHCIGDQVLQKISERLLLQIRKTDTLARLSGDEFSILLSGLKGANTIIDLVKEINEIVSQLITIDNFEFYLTLSIGISIYPEDADNAEDLLRNSDIAMYKAKTEGRNRYHFYTHEMTEKVFERLQMISSLRQAVEKNEFVVFYQPQIDAQSEQLIGMEALIRWQHNTMGLLSPDKFISLAEETGIIIQMDQWLMRVAMEQMVVWYQQGLNPGRLALNLAMKQLQKSNFIEMLSNMLLETGCKPQWLELEVTEGQIMTDPEKAIIILKEISKLGIELAVDDFGTGYSSLAYLKKLPIDKLKIDQSFVKNLPKDEDDAAITRSVIALSQNLKLKVIAEGVETDAQRDFLVQNGCRNIQGYFYSKPLPVDNMSDYLQKH